jgi:type VI secretion system protein ImpJ
LVTEEIHDYSQLKPSAEQVDCATPCFSLHLDNQSLGGYACLPIARVREVTAEGAVILDPSFIPPLIHVPDNTPPRRYLDEVIGLLNQRANTLAHRFSDAQHSAGHSALADFMLLQLVNRYEQQLRHLTKLPLLHPERLFEVLLCLASELASFTSPTKRLQLNVCYQHLALAQCFEPLMNTLHQQLGAVLEQTATQIPLEAKQFGIHVAPLGEVDKGLLNSARFVLGIRANHPTDFLRRHLPDHLKIGSVHSIRDLVNNQLSGIKPTLLPIAPREIQYSPGSVYFELDQTGEHWQRLKDSTGIALHIAGNFSELSLELWAIKL